MGKIFKIRLYIWLAISISCFISFAFLLLKGFPLNTDVLSLLPSEKQSESLSSASDEFSNRMGNHVIFLLSSSDKDQAMDATGEFAEILEQSGEFAKVNRGVNEAEQKSWGSFYFPYHLQLLSSENYQQLEQKKYQEIEQSALFSLYSPMGIANRKLLDTDPFFLYQNYILGLHRPVSDLSLDNNYLMVEKNNRWYVMISAKIAGSSFSLNTQQKILKVIDDATTLVSKNDVSVLRTGMLFYAEEGANTAQQEISTIGVGSLVGVILLLVLTFFSATPLLFTLLSIAIGFVSAFVVTYLWFGSVFIFTLVFGASLIGISVDYAFFYYAEKLLADDNWSPSIGLKHIFWGITLGLLNVVLAFVVIAIAPFPGLHQLAVFAITGLFMSYLTVVCLFPYIIKLGKIRYHKPFLLKISNAYLSFTQRISKKIIVVFFIVVAIVVAFGVSEIKANDDIHILESISKDLKNQEEQIKSITGSNIGMSYLIVLGDNEQQALTRASEVSDKVRTDFKDVQSPLSSVSDYVPTIAQQQQNYKLNQQLIADSVVEYLTKIGYTREAAEQVKQNLQNTKFKALGLDSWLDAPASEPMRFLWLGEHDNQQALAIVLAKELDLTKLQQVVNSVDGVYLVNKAAEISHIFSYYRIMITQLLGFMIVLVLVFLAWRYTLKKALVYILTPLVACLGALATFGWLGIPLTLFSLLALILILGISMDYILFLAESHKNYSSTMLAMLLSAITTILSFGLLSLSSTPAIHYFGLTVLVGIVLALILAPLSLRLSQDEI